MNRLSGRGLAALALAACLGAAGGWHLYPEPAPAASAREASAPTLACAYSDGERRAYDVVSRVGANDTEDRFRGVLSLEVVEAGEPALLRAAFTDVELAQSLSEPRDRTDAAELEAAPFFLRVDTRCQISELGFSEDWSPASRQLVSTLLRASEIVLPGSATEAWQVTQVDGGGEYVAHYAAQASDEGVRVVRHKRSYEADADAQRFGVELRVLSARAEARYDADARAIERVRGEERVELTLPGAARQVLTHRFSTARRDDGFAPVALASVTDADFGDALTLETAPIEDAVDPEVAALDREAALARYHGFFDALGRDGVLPAAELLADWLRAHPEGAAALLEDLRAGAIAEHAQATLFLALQLAGTSESRAALVDALTDDGLWDLNRARAAAALADHGAPSREVADQLMARARDDDSETVANVSRLGFGTLAGRARGELGEALRTELGDELATAGTRADVVAAIEAIGNCADDGFAPALSERLDAAEPSVRSHAAEALGQLSPEVARTALVEHLADETDPVAASSMLRGLRRLDDGAALSDADLALATSQLASPHAEVRATAIEWLGSASEQPAARRVLAGHFHAEPELRLKQRLGAFVSAAELRAAG